MPQPDHGQGADVHGTGLLVRLVLWAVWLVALGLLDAGVVYHSTTHNPVSTTLAISAGMLLADVIVTFLLLVCGVVFSPEGW